MWLQFFFIINGGLIGGVVIAVVMRFAIDWAVPEEPEIVAETPKRERRVGKIDGTLDAAVPDSDADEPSGDDAWSEEAPGTLFDPATTESDVEASESIAAENLPPTLDLPEEWLATLEAHDVAAATCFEAVVHVLRLEVGAHRDALCTLEDRLRKSLAADGSKASATLDEAMQVIGIWHERQRTASTILKNDPDFDEDSAKRGAALRMLQFQIDRHADFLQDLAPGARPRNGEALRKLGKERVGECVAMVHRVRDWVMAELAELLKSQDRLGDLPDRVVIDGATSILNRVGLERAAEQWRAANPTGERPAGIAVVHLDEFDRVNALLGTRGAELALRGFAELARSILGRDKEFDCVGRAGGVDFFMLLGDASSRQSMTNVERLRQTLEETDFVVSASSFRMTVTSCLGEFDVAAPLGEQIERLSKEVRSCGTRFGKNRTYLDSERGSEPVEAPPLQIKAKTVKLGAQIEICEKAIESSVARTDAATDVVTAS